MIICVKQKHIDVGTPCSSTSCPIALAIKEQVPGCAWATVGTDDCGFHSGNNKFIDANLSKRVQRFIGDFDRGIPGKPFSFHLDGDVIHENREF